MCQGQERRGLSPKETRCGAVERIVSDVDDPARKACFWFDPVPTTLEAALVCTLAYGDLFDYPMTAQEMHRYLVGMEAGLTDVEAVLTNGRASRHIARSGEYFTLAGRERIVDIRHDRARAAAELWPDALHCGRIMARLPFVRMVAVTGALAVDNAERGDDIDYLVVTASDRLWLCRAILIQLVVKPRARRGLVLCPNYLLSERALAHFEHNLFTAHEIVQMVPVAGRDTYRRLCDLNAWVARFLPNAYGRPRCVDGEPVDARSPSLVTEPVLRSRAAGWIERWEMKRKIDRFDRQREGETEASFSPDWCKGHFQSHGPAVRDALVRRLEALDPPGKRANVVAQAMPEGWGSK